MATKKRWTKEDRTEHRERLGDLIEKFLDGIYPDAFDEMLDRRAVQLLERPEENALHVDFHSSSDPVLYFYGRALTKETIFKRPLDPMVKEAIQRCSDGEDDDEENLVKMIAFLEAWLAEAKIALAEVKDRYPSVPVVRPAGD